MHTTLPNQLANVTMFGAIAAARKAGYGDKEQADDAAVEAMRNQFNSMPVKATIVIGEGERDEAPCCIWENNWDRVVQPSILRLIPWKYQCYRDSGTACH